MPVYLANDKYRGQLRATYIHGVDSSLAVDAVPTNVPTIVVVGWETEFETVFSVTGKSGDSAANYTLTGVTRLRGYEGNLAEGLAVNCLNNEEFFNQYGDLISGAIEDAESAASRVIAALIFDAETDVETGDGAGGVFIRIPAVLNGYELTGVAACHDTAGTGTGSDTTDIQIRNATQAVDMLSTKLTIDEDETDSSSAATPAVINTSNDDVATGDKLYIDVDAVVPSSAPLGLLVELTFEPPAV